MSKLYRLITNNIRTTSFSITIVTHYRPRSKLCANGIFSWQIKSRDYKKFQNKTYRTSTGGVSNVYCANIKKFYMWLLKYKLWKRTAYNGRNVNIQMRIVTWQMITLLCCFVIMKNKQKLYLFDYYKRITHAQKHNMLNV